MDNQEYCIIAKSTEFFLMEENDGDYELGADISEQLCTYLIADEEYRPIDFVEYDDLSVAVNVLEELKG